MDLPLCHVTREKLSSWWQKSSPFSLDDLTRLDQLTLCLLHVRMIEHVMNVQATRTHGSCSATAAVARPDRQWTRGTESKRSRIQLTANYELHSMGDFWRLLSAFCSILIVLSKAAIILTAAYSTPPPLFFSQFGF